MKYIAIILLFISSSVIASTTKHYEPKDRELYSLFCRGQFDSYVEKILARKPDDKYYLFYRLAYLASKRGQSEIKPFLDGLSSNVNGISEVDRVIAAASLFAIHSNDFSRIQSLLAFKSLNAETESYRRLLDSYLDEVTDKPYPALQKKLELFSDLSYLDVNLLTEINASAINDKNANLILGPYFKYIDQIPETDYSKYILLAYKEIATSKYENFSLIHDYIKNAYTLCKYDQSVVLFYSTILMYSEKYDEAEKILVDTVKLNDIYSPHFDFILAQIYTLKKDKEKAKFFLDKTREMKIFFPKSAQWQIDKMMERENEDKNRNSIFIGITVITFLILIFFIRRKNKKTH